MNYQGHAFHSDFENGKSSGVLNVSSEGIRFRTEEQECVFALSGLNIELAGASDRIVFFTHPANSDWKFYTADRAILKDPVLENNIHVKRQIKKVNKGKRIALYFTLVALVLLCVGVIGAWAMKDSIVHAAAKQVPVEWQSKLGDVAFDSLSSSKNIIEDEELNSQLNEMVAPLLETAANIGFEFTFHIVEDSSPNAAALPGGNVLIFTGLIERMETPEQLLGVLAHEIAHVNQLHHVRRLIDSAGLFIALDAMFGGMGALSGVILSGGTELLALKNSRENETEADLVGWDYLVDARINPRGLIESFQILESCMDHSTKEMLEEYDYLASHPALKDRIDKLEVRWEELDASSSFLTLEIDYVTFKKNLRRILSEQPLDTNKSSKGLDKKDDNGN